MFTGIIETVGIVVACKRSLGNLDLSIQSTISKELKVDQSVSHNGVCLTVVEINGDVHCVTAIQETLSKTNLGLITIGNAVNLERCMKIGDRLDGHIVQGHVDQTAACISTFENNGSWSYRFRLADTNSRGLIVEKGSITVNGISLTAFQVDDDSFCVAIIPYTFEHTNIREVKAGSVVNLEFDVIGKYVERLIAK